MQTDHFLTKVLSLAGNYFGLRTNVPLAQKYRYKSKRRNFAQLKDHVQQSAVPFSLTMNNLIIDQKMGKII